MLSWLHGWEDKALQECNLSAQLSVHCRMHRSGSSFAVVSWMKLGAVCAMARKLAVAIWYLMMGRWTTLEEINAALKQKVGKIISQVGATGLKKLNKTRKIFGKETLQSLKTGDVYVLDPRKKFTAKVPIEHPSMLAEEYGLR